MTYKKGDKKIMICNIPHRQKKVLLVTKGNAKQVIACFHDDKSAELFEKYLDSFIMGEPFTGRLEV